MADTPMPETRSYGCTFGCGNPYDFVVVSVLDGTTELLCVPCFVRMASDMVHAVTEATDAEAAKWLADAGTMQQAPMNGRKPRARGKNAPATSTDPDIIEAFDTVITVDELPEEFR